MTCAYKIRNLGCASCAAKMERKICALRGVQSARVNFLTQRLTLEADDSQVDSILKQAGDIIKTIEPQARLVVSAQ